MEFPKENGLPKMLTFYYWICPFLGFHVNFLETPQSVGNPWVVHSRAVSWSWKLCVIKK